jgi:hypothetical protein
MFNVLLVYPNLQMINLMPSNISILSACLKEKEFDVKLFGAIAENDDTKYDEQLSRK